MERWVGLGWCRPQVIIFNFWVRCCSCGCVVNLVGAGSKIVPRQRIPHVLWDNMLRLLSFWSSATNIDNLDMILFLFSSLFNLPSVFSACEDGTSCKTLPFIIIIFLIQLICLLMKKKRVINFQEYISGNIFFYLAKKSE